LLCELEAVEIILSLLFELFEIILSLLLELLEITLFLLLNEPLLFNPLNLLYKHIYIIITIAL